MIATKNSAGWFGEILHAYRKLAIQPLVLLDNASEDGTKELLEREQIEFTRVIPEFPRVEAIVRLIPNHTDAQWVLRLDDDEFPSHALIDWIPDRLDSLDTNIVGIPRRWVRMGKNEHCEFSNHPLLKQDQDKMDIQWRLFRPDRVDYITDIHSPGFRASAGLVAPDEAFLVHFDWIIRSRQARARKVADYDRQQGGAGSDFHDLYLWEDSDLAAHGFQPMETTEFDRLARSIRID
ncbi:glycosyltransferase family 2 protein [Candidatus Thiosymbion oneisti]|uniref:glycosyltransferase family 2 protein n=1 Tax=Candidatus Thiosymbion oneisti TaxID=589554 RepID=UPI00159F2D28|nr:glycosyltransferase family 2 protein [Candidatus Thiosymbion oneisti]